MSITFPTFVDKEIVSPEKLNDFVSALEAKFTAGLGSAEIQWPLVAAGNVVMGDYEVTGGTRVFGVVNASQYATLQLAITAANAYGDGTGGIVFIPPNTTIRADGVNISGNYTAIVGAGPSSVIKLTDAASAGYLLRNTNMGSGTQFLVANLTLDGNGQIGGEGLLLRQAWSSVVHNVTFRNFDGAALHLTSGAASGQACVGIQISNCFFSGGDDHHILGDDCIDVKVTNCKSSGCDTRAFEFIPKDTSAYIQRIIISGNTFDTSDDGAIAVRGGSATVNALWESIHISDNVIDGTGTTAQPTIQVGIAGAVVQKFSVVGNQITDAPVDGIEVCGEHGMVSDNHCYDAGNDGITLHVSKYVNVCDNDFSGATGVGVLATSSTSCMIHDNILTGCATALQYGATTERWNNPGAVGTPPASGYYTASKTIVFPANYFKTGDMLDVSATFSLTAGTNRVVNLMMHNKSVGYVYAGSATGQCNIRSTILFTGSNGVHYSSVGACDARDTAVRTAAVTGIVYTAATTLTVALTDANWLTWNGIKTSITRVETV